MTAVISSVSIAKSSSTTISSTASQAGILPAAATFISGLALVFLVGFAPMAEMHNAAHDTRHSAAFPCH